MSIHELEQTAEIARRISAEPTLASSAVGAIATEWATNAAKQETLQDQQVATAANYDNLVPHGATPTSILRGDFGEKAKIDFLSGALAAVDHMFNVRTEVAE